MIEESYNQKKIFGDDIFAFNVINRIKRLDTFQKSNIVISDFRFKSEYDYVKNFYKDDPSTLVKTIRVNRFETSPVNSISENQLNDFEFNYYISNTGTLDSFYKSIDVLLIYHEII